MKFKKIFMYSLAMFMSFNLNFIKSNAEEIDFTAMNPVEKDLKDINIPRNFKFAVNNKTSVVKNGNLYFFSNKYPKGLTDLANDERYNASMLYKINNNSEIVDMGISLNSILEKGEDLIDIIDEGNAISFIVGSAANGYLSEFELEGVYYNSKRVYGKVLIKKFDINTKKQIFSKEINKDTLGVDELSIYINCVDLVNGNYLISSISQESGYNEALGGNVKHRKLGILKLDDSFELINSTYYGMSDVIQNDNQGGAAAPTSILENDFVPLSMTSELNEDSGVDFVPLSMTSGLNEDSEINYLTFIKMLNNKLYIGTSVFNYELDRYEDIIYEVDENLNCKKAVLAEDTYAGDLRDIIAVPGGFFLVGSYATMKVDYEFNYLAYYDIYGYSYRVEDLGDNKYLVLNEDYYDDIDFDIVNSDLEILASIKSLDWIYSGDENVLTNGRDIIIANREIYFYTLGNSSVEEEDINKDKVKLSIDSENSLEVSLSTNNISFYDYNGTSDFYSQFDVVTKSSLNYDLYMWLTDEIRNVDNGDLTIDINNLEFKEFSWHNFSKFEAVNNRVCLVENGIAGYKRESNVNLRLLGDSTVKEGHYITNIKIEAIQR